MVAGRDVVGREHMKDAVLMFVSLGFAAGFAYLACFSAMKYYTTWALAAHSVYFAAFVLSNVLFGGDSVVVRWGFAPGLCIAITVAVVVIYLLASQWDEMFEEYCLDSKQCYDLIIEFMLGHYVPPVAYLLVFVLDGTRQHVVDRQKTEMLWWYRWGLLSQMSLLPALVYATHYDMNAVYGEGTKLSGIFMYGAISGVWALGWSIYFKA
jgi:hypothetical protein